MIRDMDALRFLENGGTFSVEDRVAVAKLYSKEVEHSEENMEFLDRVFVEDEHPLGYLLEQELESELIRNIEELPLECRTVFKKNRFEQKKYEEIAIELNISVNTVKYHMKKALSCLQQRMEKYLKLLVLYVFLGN